MKQTIAKLLASSYLLTLLSPLSTTATEVSPLPEPNPVTEEAISLTIPSETSSKQERATPEANDPSDFEYTISSNNVTITGHSITSGDAVIPETIEDYPVRHIAAGAFKDSNIETIFVPDSVWTIGHYAFQGCEYLTYASLGESLQSLGEYSFFNCKLLARVDMGDQVVTIGQNSFSGCAKLSQINLSKSLTSITDSMFRNCVSLEMDFIIPDSVVSIEGVPFWGSSNISSIYVPETTTNISSQAFAYYTLGSTTYPHTFPIRGVAGSAVEEYCSKSTGYSSKLTFEVVDYSDDFIAATGITLSDTTIAAEVDRSYLLIPTFSPIDASNQAITWTSSNEDVATVSETGWVKGVGDGTATITATTQDGGFKAICTVTVGDAPSTSSYTITFNANNGSVSPTSGTTGTDGKLTTLPTPTRSGYTFNGWYTSATGGAKVSISTAFSSNTTIYAQWTEDSGDNEDSEEEDNTSISVTGVTVNMSATGVVAGETKSLSATVAPSNATNKAVTWKSSNTSVATVNSSGVVTGVSAGTATITVTTADGGKTDTCSVTVTAAPSTTYTILFNGNGGAVTTFSGTTGSNGTLSSLPTPTRTGYTFTGWFTTATGSTKVTTSTVFTEDGSIYAQWTKNDTSQDPPYTIKFSPMGGKVSDSTKDTNDIGKLLALPTVTRSGYEFQGWFTLSSGGTEISTSTVFTADATVYAQWQKEVTEEEEEDTDDEDTDDEDTQDDTEDTVPENDVVFSGIGTSTAGGTVTFSATNPSQGTKVTLAITPFTNHLIETIRILDEDYQEVKFYRDLASRNFFFYQPETTVTADVTFRNTSASPHTSTYSDVNYADWYQEYVSYLTSFGLMNGSGGNFYPETNADRGTIAQALLLLGKESSTAFTDGTTTFVDISGSAYWDAVVWCSARGVMSGYNDTIFGATDLLTREQFATTLASFAKAMNLSSTNTTYPLTRFFDVGNISSWATDSVAWCVENDLMAGFDGYLNPQDTLTRGELATMLTTFYKKFVA